MKNKIFCILLSYSPSLFTMHQLTPAPTRISLSNRLEFLLTHENRFFLNPFFNSWESKHIASYMPELGKNNIYTTLPLKEKITYKELGTLIAIYQKHFTELTQRIHDTTIGTSLANREIYKLFHEKLFATVHENPFTLSELEWKELALDIFPTTSRVGLLKKSIDNALGLIKKETLTSYEIKILFDALKKLHQVLPKAEGT